MRVWVMVGVLCATLATAVNAELNTVVYISNDGNGEGRLDLDDAKGDLLDSSVDPGAVDLGGVTRMTLLDGEGGDMWNGGDQFTYLYDSNKVTGDFTATVRVVAQTESVEGRWGKAGVTARANLTGLSQNVMTQVAAGTGSQVDPPGTGDHSPVPVRIAGRTGSDGQGGFEVGIGAPIDPTGLEIVGGEIRNNVFAESEANVVDPDTNAGWLRLHYRASTNSFVSSYARDVDGTPGSWGYSPAVSNVPLPSEEDGEGWYVGLGYSAHNSLQLADVADDDALHGVSFDNYSIVNEYIKPELYVSGLDQGELTISGEKSDVELGDLVNVQGLSQYWYDANMRNNPEAFLEAGLEGTEDYPLVNPGGEAIISEDTWWRGSQGQVITGLDLERYPAGLGGTRFDGSTNEDNYSVRLQGEIFIPADGDYLIRDGVDDFTMVAIDADGNGELDELDDILNDDVGSIGGVSFGDVHVLDDDWANLDGGDQQADFHGVAEIEGIAADGEWRKIEIWTAEGGGGDGGIVYMGDLDDENIFDDTNGGGLTQEERDMFVIRPENLRTQTNEILSGNSTASLSGDVEYVMEIGPDGNDVIRVDDLEGVLTTTLDVQDATVRLVAGEGLEEGTVVTIFDADTVTGDADFVFVGDEQWTYLGMGQVRFGEGGTDPTCADIAAMREADGLTGDLNNDGQVSFPDFLTLNSNFNSETTMYEDGDIDCSGVVEFPDFLALSGNFGAGGAAAAVPEPSSLALLGIGGLLAGLLRRRRN